MAPPKYDDLGQSSNEVFTNGYHLGIFNLIGKFKANTGLEVNAVAKNTIQNEAMDGWIQWAYDIPDLGLSLQEKFYTDKVLFSEIAINNLAQKGVRLIFNNIITPGKSLSTQMIAESSNDYFTNTASIDTETKYATVTTVFNQRLPGLVLALKMQYDVGASKLIKNNFTVGYHGEEFALNSFVNNQTEFGADMYHRASPRTDVAVNLGWNRAEQATWFGLAAVHRMDWLTTLRAKFLSSSQLGLSVTRSLRPGLNITLTSLLNTQNLSQGGHRIGAGIDLEL